MIEAKNEVRKLLKISGTYYLSIPPNFVKAHNLDPGDGLLVQIGDVLTVSPVPKGDVLIPNEEILLPYPEDIDTDDASRLKVAAFAQNYQRINEYAKKERPNWEQLEVTMKTVARNNNLFFLVTGIANASEK